MPPRGHEPVVDEYGQVVGRRLLKGEPGFPPIGVYPRFAKMIDFAIEWVDHDGHQQKNEQGLLGPHYDEKDLSHGKVDVGVVLQ